MSHGPHGMELRQAPNRRMGDLRCIRSLSQLALGPAGKHCADRAWPGATAPWNIQHDIHTVSEVKDWCPFKRGTRGDANCVVAEHCTHLMGRLGPAARLTIRLVLTQVPAHLTAGSESRRLAAVDLVLGACCGWRGSEEESSQAIAYTTFIAQARSHGGWRRWTWTGSTCARWTSLPRCAPSCPTAAAWRP